MKKLLLFLIILIIITFANQAFAAVVGSTDDPMSVGGGARPLGMGRAFTAIADDADAPFINPAGLAGLKGPQGMTMFTNLMGEVYYTELCGSIPSEYGAVGAGLIMTGVNGIPTDTGPLADYYDSLFLLSYSTPLARFFQYANNVFVGGNIKFFSRGFSGGISQYASGTSADIGLKYIFSPNLSFGICRQNFLPVSFGGVLRISGGAEESIAGITKIGFAARPVPFGKDLLLAFDTDLPAQSGRPITFHFGTEWKQSEYLTLRGGLDQSLDAATDSHASTNWTCGLSLGYAGFRVDYAYHPYYNDPSLATNYLSLSYQAEPWFALKGRTE
ncbi:MAG: hypothetical protein WC863_04620 [Patescibacteria group bacterium]